VITYVSSPVCEKIDIKNLEFGSAYKGKHMVWSFRFSPDRSGVYSKNHSEVGSLVYDLDQVPIIKNLTETINIDKAMFNCTDQQYRNVIVKMIQDIE